MNDPSNKEGFFSIHMKDEIDKSLYINVKPEVFGGEMNWFSLLYLLRKMMGPALSREIFNLLSDKEQVSDEDLATQIDEKIYARLSELFGNIFIKNGIDPQSVIRIYFELADQTVNQLRELGFPGTQYTYGLLNPTSVNPLSPMKNFKDVMGVDRKGGISDRARYEVLRKMVLALLLVNLRNLRAEFNLYDDLQKLADLLEEDFMEDPRGSGHNKKLYVLHDPQTNQVLEIFYDPESAQVAKNKYLGSKPTVHVHRVRRIQSDDADPKSIEVMYHIREKSPQRTVVKAIGEGTQAGISFEDGLSDELGLMIVAYGNRNQVFDQIVKFIKSKYPSTRIEDKSKVKADNGQSQSIYFKRVAIYLHGDDKPPVELVVYDIKDYLNAQYQVAVRDESGKLDYQAAPAHPLYEQRRANKVADLVYPPEIYPRDENEAKRDYQFYMSIVARLLNS